MSFDKNYPNRKDRRKQFVKAKSVDKRCRCHGGCSYCEGNRQYTTNKRKQKADNDLKLYGEKED